MLIYLFLFVWYCGPKCKGCRHQRCINEYENYARDQADEKSPYCLLCERPACNFCGKGYDGKRAFAVSSGKPYICDNKTCKSKKRKEQGRWISDACVLLWIEHFSRLATCRALQFVWRRYGSAGFALKLCMTGGLRCDAFYLIGAVWFQWRQEPNSKHYMESCRVCKIACQQNNPADMRNLDMFECFYA